MPAQGPHTTIASFLFTDVEGSTRLWEQHPVAMRAALESHDEVWHDVISSHGGSVFSAAGDSFAAAFTVVGDAVAAVVEAQRRLARVQWPATGPLRVRCGIHTGPAQARAGDYFGPTLNRGARLMAIGHGAQVLLSAASAELARTALPDGCELIDLGRHRLKDLEDAEHVFQLTHPDLVRDFPPLRSLGSFATNLPVHPSSFIGRHALLDQLAGTIRSHRISTLVGPGGAGKTRLATQAAADAVDGFPGGVWFVDLSGLTEPQLVLNAVADAVQVEEAGESLLAEVAQRLDRLPTLLILDNCEHLIAAAASVATALVRAAPALTLVATSREPLEVPGEAIFPVEPLAIPSGTDLAALAASDAVQLFVERARLADPEFQLTEANVADVVEICRHLDGIPLAIELAAARMRHLGVRGVAERLDDRFRLLSRGDRTAAARQQTLRNAIDWSHDLLEPEARVLLRRLAVFAGSFALDDVVAVAGFAPLPEDEHLDVVSGLVDRSLVRAERTDDGRRRYRLLETLRAYGAERLLEAGESEIVDQRHVDHFLAFIQEAKAGVRGEDAASWHDRIAARLDDLRAVLQRSIARGDIAVAADVAAGCWYHWYVRGHWDEGYRWLARIRDLGSDLPDGVRADVLRGLGGLATASGKPGEGATYLEEEVALRRTLEDRSGESAALLNLANALALDERLEEAVPNYERSLEISRQLGEEISSVMSNIAWTALDMGDVDEARSKFADTLRLASEEGQVRNQAWGHLGLGIVAWLRGDLDEAGASLVQGRRLFSAFQDRAMMTFCRTFEIKVVRDRGDLDAAAQMARDLVVEIASLGDEGSTGRWLTTCAVIECRRQRFESAAQLLGALGDPHELPAWERAEVDDVIEILRRELGSEGYRHATAEGERAGREALLRAGLTQ